MSTAAKVRREKEQYPERFCSVPRCLWRVVKRGGSEPCPKHTAIDLMQALKESLANTART